MRARLSETWILRKKSALPFYCRPLLLFLAEWFMILVFFQMHIAVYSYPSALMAFAIFGASLLSMLLGYSMIRLMQRHLAPRSARPSRYSINLSRLRRVQLWLIVVSAAIILINLAIYGPPPVFRFWGAVALNYVEYGKLKQVLNATTMALFVSASFESSSYRKWFARFFSISCMMAYATRGFLLVMLMQGLFVFSLRTGAKKKTLYAVALSIVIVAALISNIIGNGRIESTSDAFVSFFGIRDAYADWPMSVLWVISYIATPFSNLCWIIHSYRYTGPSLTFLGSLLPAFWSPTALETGYLGSPNIIDGVHTYLAKYYLDLWYFGIFLINYVWGVICGYLEAGNRLTANSLTSSVFLASIAFMFFADYLTFLSVLMELATLAFIQRNCVRWFNSPGLRPT